MQPAINQETGEDSPANAENILTITDIDQQIYSVREYDAATGSYKFTHPHTKDEYTVTRCPTGSLWSVCDVYGDFAIDLSEPLGPRTLCEIINRINAAYSHGQTCGKILLRAEIRTLLGCAEADWETP